MDTWTFLGTIVAPMVQAATSIVGVFGVFLVWRQITETNKWNRANAQHAMLSNLPTLEFEQLLWRTLEKYKAPQSWQLPRDQCDRLYDQVDDWTVIKTFLNKHEQLCAAINANTLDEDYAYSVHGAKVVDTYFTFEHYIDYIRKRRDNFSIFLELEKVATRWAARAKLEEEELKREQQELRSKRGAPKAVS